MKNTQIKIASPCSARWEDMKGDERRRFCQQCSKHVYNFTQMRPEEITALIQEKEGRVCARLYQRADGRMLSENCPVGMARAARRVKAFAGAAFAAVAIAAASVMTRKSIENAAEVYEANPVRTKIDEAIWTVKGWMGIRPPSVIMGDICPIPTRPTGTNSDSTPTNSAALVPPSSSLNTNGPAFWIMGEVCLPNKTPPTK